MALPPRTIARLNDRAANEAYSLALAQVYTLNYGGCVTKFAPGS